jgi:hypothetical protein
MSLPLPGRMTAPARNAAERPDQARSIAGRRCMSGGSSATATPAHASAGTQSATRATAPPGATVSAATAIPYARSATAARRSTGRLGSRPTR